MKTNWKLLSLAAIMTMASSAMAEDVYVYTTGSVVPVLHMPQMRCIVFGEEGIDVLGIDGQAQNVQYEAFDYFRFYETPDLDGVKAPGMTVGQPGIYSITGTYYGKEEDGKESLPSGIYIVREAKNGQESVKKVIKK